MKLLKAIQLKHVYLKRISYLFFSFFFLLLQGPDVLRCDGTKIMHMYTVMYSIFDANMLYSHWHTKTLYLHFSLRFYDECKQNQQKCSKGLFLFL